SYNHSTALLQYPQIKHLCPPPNARPLPQTNINGFFYLNRTAWLLTPSIANHHLQIIYPFLKHLDMVHCNY
ncbi:hypothetical protein M8C21_025920, partial [Ambrosia artemisiifolia]